MMVNAIQLNLKKLAKLKVGKSTFPRINLGCPSLKVIMMISEGFDGKEQRADFITNVVKKVEWDYLLTSYEQIVKEAPR